MRLIDADELIEIAHRIRLDSRERIERMIESAPTVAAIPLEDFKSMEQTVNKLTNAIADADPVKHGHWKRTDILFCRQNAVRCSCCGHLTPTYGKVLDSFCRFCGAKMDEVEEDG